MEDRVIQNLRFASKVLGLPLPVDARPILPVNKQGIQWNNRVVEDIEGMVWHQLLGWGSLMGTARYHTGPGSHLAPGVGVESIAYTLYIDRQGCIHQCNNFSKKTWSQGDKYRPGDENADFLGVAFEGDFYVEGLDNPDAGEPNDVQILAGLMVWKVCKDLWGWDETCLYGHFDFGKPACPGDTLQTVIKAIQSNGRRYDLSCMRGRQGALKELGHYSGAVDGIWGVGSVNALRLFQDVNGLVVDGAWGASTEKMVGRKLSEVSQ